KPQSSFPGQSKQRNPGNIYRADRFTEEELGARTLWPVELTTEIQFLQSGTEQDMRLNAMQLDATLKQVDMQVIPDEHPTTAKLADLFGDHTFFIDGTGLKGPEQPGA